MTYEKLTNLDLTFEKVPVLEINGKTVYDEKLPDFERSLYESGLMIRDYDRVLEDAGIDTASAHPFDYDIESMDANHVLALLTAIVRKERFCEGTIASCVKSGLVEELIERLADIDYENRPFPAWLEKAARQALESLRDFSSDQEISPYNAIKPFLPSAEADGGENKATVRFNLDFDIPDALNRYAKDFGLYLDTSAYDDMVVGLPINIPFRVRHVPVGSSGPETIFSFSYGGWPRGETMLSLLRFLDGIDGRIEARSQEDCRSFEVTDRQVQELKDLLVTLDAFHWGADYDDPSLDGVQWSLAFSDGDIHVKSEGSNAFPEGFDKLLDFLADAFDCEQFAN